ncbi:amidase [Fusarium pseudoanthophilum]|uniref:Amidase n=1 Tax=Fusarium pseudoanthophilum TaxID=48495 RepID=A0A8H5L079_9HYPO|nr:amidase [Fusarium pseudoanthophilum]
MNSPPYKWTATRALELLRNDSISVEAYAQSLLGRIQERDRTIKAWAHLDPELVLSQARLLDKIPIENRGPLHGLAIGIKDIMDTKEYGSRIYDGHQPSADSHAVATLRAAGALIFGKTTTTEFAVANYGPWTANPHNPKHTPGGSSSGSAAAVADFQVPLSLGSQTGGSVIRPASYTGVFAMKPTFGAISTEGQKPCAPSFDTIGFFARSIEDLRLLADVFGLKDDEAPKETSLDQISVAVIKTPFWSSAGYGTESAMDNSISVLERNKVKVEEVSFPAEVSDSKVLGRIQDVIIQSEARVSLLPEYRLSKAKLGYEVRDIVKNKSNITQEELRDAYDEYAKMRVIINDLAKKYDVILAPSAVDHAPVGLDDMGSPIFNTLWTGFHMPVINIPSSSGAWGMPIGVSLVAPRFQDQQLLQTGKAISEILMADGTRRSQDAEGLWKRSWDTDCISE